MGVNDSSHENSRLTTTAHKEPTEQRRVPRYPFVAEAEIVDLSSGVRLSARVTDLSFYGCYVDMAHSFPNGSRVFVKIFARMDFLEAEARVIYSQPNLGAGLAFSDVKPHFLSILRKWLHGAMQDAFDAGH